MKSVQIRSFFWSVFSNIRTAYSVSFRIQSEYGKKRTRKNSVFGYISRSQLLLFIEEIWLTSLSIWLWFKFLFQDSKKFFYKIYPVLQFNNCIAMLFVLYFYIIFYDLFYIIFPYGFSIVFYYIIFLALISWLRFLIRSVS